MANKRQLKKAIKNVCGDIADVCIINRVCVPGVSAEEMNRLICEAAKLQCDTVERVSFAFDKTPGSFASGREYNAARAKYFRHAYAKLRDGLREGVMDIVSAMNAALPQEQKELNKKEAK